MIKNKTKKRITILLIVAAVFIGIFGVAEYKKINAHNMEIDELVNTDRGTFRDLYPEYPQKGVLITLFDLDALSLDGYRTDEEKEQEINSWKKYNIDITKIKEPSFMFKYGAMKECEPDNIIIGSWSRNKKGDYELIADNKVFAYIIEKKNDGFIKKQKPEYVLILNDTGEKYYMQKIDNSSHML